MSIPYEESFFDNEEDEEEMDTKVTVILNELQAIHGSNIPEVLIRPMIVEIIMVQEEVHEYDLIVLSYRKSNAITEIPSKLIDLRMKQAGRLSKLRDQLGAKLDKMMKKVDVQEEDPLVAFSYDNS